MYAITTQPDTPRKTVAAPSVLEAGDIVAAVTDLCSRAGAHSVEIGYNLVDGAQGPADWYAFTAYHGTLISERGHTSPGAACYALAIRLISGVRCGCNLDVALDPGTNYPGVHRPWIEGAEWTIADARREGWCLWQQHDKRWHPACEMLPIELPHQHTNAPGINIPAAYQGR